MPLADTAAAPTVAAAAAGRLRVDTAALRRNAVLAAMIEREVGALPGVRAVQAFPWAASVVVWHSAECDASIVVAVIGDVARRQVSSAESGPTTSRPVDRHDSGGVVGRVLRALLPARRDPQPEPPEIERLRLALGRLGYHIAEREVNASSAVSTLRVGADHGRARLRWLAVPLGVALVGLTGLTVYRVARWAVVGTTLTRTPGNRLGRPRSSLAVVAASALAVPSWGGVMVTLILVSVAGTVAYRHRLGLTREIVVAAGRAAVQLIAAGTLLRLLFARANVLGAAGWLAGMTIVAGQVAGGRAAGLPQARVAATGGVAASAAFTLAVLQVGRVVTAQARVIVPVGGMIISSAMLAAGGSLRRLDSDVRNARPAIEARLSLGQDSRQAIRPYRQAALRGALIPAIDSTKVVGLISLPGAMTGLILAGISPLTAIRYQIVVMYMQLAGSALASLVALRIAEESLFDDAQRLVPLTSPDELPSLASPTT